MNYMRLPLIWLTVPEKPKGKNSGSMDIFPFNHHLSVRMWIAHILLLGGNNEACNTF